MDVDTYLHRIGYTGSREPVAGTLRELHRIHMLTVPFENLDIHSGRPIILDAEKLFDKIVRRHRGGFCYELNGLFSELLQELGFDVTMLSARVYSGGIPGPEFDHMALPVELEERWLADVGFGESFIEPLKIDDPDEQVQRGVGYCIRRDGEIWNVMERRPGAEWMVTYQFDLHPRQLPEYAERCSWHQTSPASHFTQKRVCSLATQEGRVTLSGMKLLVTEHGEQREEVLSGDDAYRAALKRYFGFEEP